MILPIDSQIETSHNKRLCYKFEKAVILTIHKMSFAFIVDKHDLYFNIKKTFKETMEEAIKQLSYFSKEAVGLIIPYQSGYAMKIKPWEAQYMIARFDDRFYKLVNRTEQDPLRANWVSESTNFALELSRIKLNTLPDEDIYKKKSSKKLVEEVRSEEPRLLEISTDIVRPHIRGDKLVETLGFDPSDKSFYTTSEIKYWLLRFNTFSSVTIILKEVNDTTLRFEKYTVVKLHFRKAKNEF